MASPFVSKDGSKHTNHSSMKNADMRFASKQPAPGAGAAGDGGMDDGMGGDEEPQDGAALAAEHGPATELNIVHDHEGGHHKVHAVHPDGHAHDTEHPTADEAHQFAAAAAGVGAGGGAGMGGGM